MKKLFYILAAAGLLSGCSASSPSSSSSDVAIPASPTLGNQLFSSSKPGQVKVVPSALRAEQNQIKMEAERLLAARNYQQIEKRVQSLRQSKAEHADGIWHLSSFYRGLAVLPHEASAAQWEQRTAQLQSWVKQSPGSLTAHIALARSFYEGAFRARGHGWSSTVNSQMARLMNDRTSKALDALEKVASQRKRCPVWYAVAQRIALLQSWPRVQYDQLVDEGIRISPTYKDFHFMRMYYLLPRWYGKQGEWESYALRAANKTGGTEGDILYAQMIWNMQSEKVFEDMKEDTDFSWPRAKKGYAALLQRYPTSLEVASSYAAVAVNAEDVSLARFLFEKKIQNRVNLDVWGNKKTFLSFRNWAYR